MVAKQDTNCPDCGGTNYFRPVGQPNHMAQCYECGYNPRFTQTTAGLPSGDKSTPSTPARQIASGGLGGRSNYNPGAIIKADGTV
jgi:predicted nucleic-acid-binding Zn-ribbon protein